MPTLEEYRRWLQGEQIDGLPDRDLSGNALPEPAPETVKLDEDGVVVRKAGITAKGGHYTIHANGKDATLNFGKYKDYTISELAGEKSTITYLEWMMQQDFPDELMRIVKAYAHPLGPEAHELGLVDEAEECEACDGSGITPDGADRCEVCLGTGMVGELTT